ncbi:MAG: aspartate/glutamate racemase family protein [SAR324 cluster bacterium]|nr:aspartate/glutamate racemase family protein [SAR324 cluster bacterium]MBL7036102.1 aspartate/glutamate racemase family protein [SAR324 cluster bacterium]
MSSNDAKIGIVAGAGPYAGLDLTQKILQQTEARKDQDYLPTISISTPSQIADRTHFLLGQTTNNPAHAIFQNLTDLAELGATVAGIPCNTAHAPAIRDVFLEKLKESGMQLKLLDMISETINFLKEVCPDVKTVGVLSTIGTWKAGFYPKLLSAAGYDIKLLEESEQQHLHDMALFHPEFGIKVQANPVSSEARNVLLNGVRQLQRQGVQAIVLGCTEIPLGLPEAKLGATYLIDPGLILARALIREFCPEKLLPWSWDT